MPAQHCVGLAQESAGRLQILLPRLAFVLPGQHPLQPPAVEQHVAQLRAGCGGQGVLGLFGKKLRKGFLGRLQGLVALGLGQGRGRIDVGDGQFVVDGFREGLRRAGIRPGVLEIIDRLVIMALGPQSVEDFFLRVRSQRRTRAEQKHHQNGGKNGLRWGLTMHKE